MKGKTTLARFRLVVLSASLVLLVNSGPVLTYGLAERWAPKNLFGGRIEDPLILLPLVLMTDLGGIVLLLMSAGIGAMIWLLSMKLFFSNSEMATFLGLAAGKPSRAKRLVKWLVDFVY